METIEETRARVREIVGSSGGKVGRWILSHLDYQDADWCLIFPFSWEAGHYPKLSVYRDNRKNYQVHRLMCEYRNGKPPSPEHHAAHNCGRGLQGCVNPLHVEWKTASQNQLDRGDCRPKFKLTPEDVEQIKVLGRTEMPGDLARRFGVTVRNIRLILSGRAWAGHARGCLSEEEVREIRKRFGTKPAPVLAAEFGITLAAFSHIAKGRTYRWVK